MSCGCHSHTQVAHVVTPRYPVYGTFQSTPVHTHGCCHQNHANAQVNTVSHVYYTEDNCRPNPVCNGSNFGSAIKAMLAPREYSPFIRPRFRCHEPVEIVHKHIECCNPPVSEETVLHATLTESEVANDIPIPYDPNDY